MSTDKTKTYRRMARRFFEAGGVVTLGDFLAIHDETPELVDALILEREAMASEELDGWDKLTRERTEKSELRSEYDSCASMARGLVSQ